MSTPATASPGVARAARRGRMQAQRWNGNGGPLRNWLSASVDPYSNPQHRVELLVLEGSPPVGYVLVTETFVLAISGGGRRTRRFRISA